MEVGAEDETALEALTYLQPAEAAALLGYEDVNALGCFFRSGDGSRTPVTYTEAEQLPTELASGAVAYDQLRAFQTRDGRGWGVCCASSIRAGQVVVEAIGRCMNEHDYSKLSLEAKEYVIGFNDQLLGFGSIRIG